MYFYSSFLVWFILTVSFFTISEKIQAAEAPTAEELRTELQILYADAVSKHQTLLPYVQNTVPPVSEVAVIRKKLDYARGLQAQIDELDALKKTAMAALHQTDA
ncbi:MAG: hypothetical protein HQK53_05710 [Oligoflexia bacterium]|nr:hypothetical protein [Oligoflexia bacterium]